MNTSQQELLKLSTLGGLGLNSGNQVCGRYAIAGNFRFCCGAIMKYFIACFLAVALTVPLSIEINPGSGVNCV